MVDVVDEFARRSTDYTVRQLAHLVDDFFWYEHHLLVISFPVLKTLDDLMSCI